jgi:polar amino acid transport system permease protein
MQATHHQPSKIPLAYKRSTQENLSRIPLWALIILVAGLFLLYMILANHDYHDTFTYLVSGVKMTLKITLMAFPIATVIGLFTGLARMSKNIFLYTIATIYVEIIRGIPIVVLILMIAFALVPICVDLVNKLGVWGLALVNTGTLGNFFNNMQAFSIRQIPMDIRAVTALALCYGAFEAEIFRAGIQSISRGQMEAARSLGMNYIQCMRFIILPQAIRRVLPPLGNDFIAMLKDSSLATVLAVPELTQLTRLRRSSTFRVMEAFNVAAFLYLTMTLVLSVAVRVLERKMKIEE